jgi:hypothetical protein
VPGYEARTPILLEHDPTGEPDPMDGLFQLTPQRLCPEAID